MQSVSSEEEGESRNHLTDIRLVLLGSKYSDKSTVGNIILGERVFDPEDKTVVNIVGQGEVAGRWSVTVVESAGWWKTLPPKETLELMKMRMIESVTLCDPGPHAFLLVLDLDRVLDEKSGKSVEEHLELLGEDVWSHTLVLLKFGVWQKMYSTIGEYMEKRGRVLQGIVEKCKRRCHLLNCNDTGSRTQVIGLLEMVEKMVDANGGKLFQVDAAVAQDAERRLEDVNKKAKEREIRDEAEREALRERYKDVVHHLPEIRLLLVGWFLSGKTMMGDTILGIPPNERRRTNQCSVRRGQVGPHLVRLVDTPGWARFSSLKETPEMVKQELTRGVSLCAPGPHAVILVVSSVVAFTDANLRSIREHMSFLTPDIWRHTLVLFSWRDNLGGTTIEQFIESEGSAIQMLLRKCHNRYHCFNVADDDPAQVTELLEKIEWMVAENSVLCLNEDEPWEDEGNTAEPVSPSSDSLTEMFEKYCKDREEDLELCRRFFSQAKANSIEEPPCLSDEEKRDNEMKVSAWLREQLWAEGTSGYQSDAGSVADSNQ